MKVLYFITGLGLGGAERVVVDLADSFSEKGHSVLLVYMTGPAALRPRNSEIPVVGLKIKGLFSALLAFIRFVKISREFSPNLIHSHMVHANIFARLARIFYRGPGLICTAHNSNEGGSLRMLAYRITDPLADITTNVSEEAAQIFVKKKAVPAARIRAVSNGISASLHRFDVKSREYLRGQLGVKGECQLILAAGRLTEAKDYPNLLNAFSLLMNSGVHARLVIAGEGPLLHMLEDVTLKLGIESRVKFLGQRTDLPSLMSAADVFALSSAWEGFGLVVAEAMACERVVVATDCGGVREVVGGCGYIVPPRNSEMLAESLKNACSLSAEQRAEIGKTARERVVNEYSLDAAVGKWLELYRGFEANK